MELENDGTNSIFFHEDDYRQVEILPIENVIALKAKTNSQIKFALEHFDGHGFTDAQSRDGQERVELSERLISVSEFEQVVHSLELDRANTVLTGYSTHREIAPNTVGFNGGGYASVFYSYSNGFIQHIWFTNNWDFDRERFVSFLNQIGLRWELLLVDWNLADVVDLRSTEYITRYFEEN